MVLHRRGARFARALLLTRAPEDLVICRSGDGGLGEGALEEWRCAAEEGECVAWLRVDEGAEGVLEGPEAERCSRCCGSHGRGDDVVLWRREDGVAVSS
jgi:hypothetical protein